MCFHHQRSYVDMQLQMRAMLYNLVQVNHRGSDENESKPEALLCSLRMGRRQPHLPWRDSIIGTVCPDVREQKEDLLALLAVKDTWMMLAWLVGSTSRLVTPSASASEPPRAFAQCAERCCSVMAL